MNHPQREEWVPYVFGEAGTEARLRLKEHLRGCAECRMEIEAWQRSLGRLKAWKLPRARASHEALLPVLRWALAATVVLGLGFGLGRFSPPGGVARTELAAATRAAVDAALQDQIRPLVAGEVRRELDRAQEETSNSLADLEARLAADADRGSRELLHSVAELLEQGRAGDRQAVLALFRQLEEQHVTAYVALRKDLETLASLADNEMQQARQRLTELAGADAPRQ